MTFRVVLARRDAEALAARAIREERNLVVSRRVGDHPQGEARGGNQRVCPETRQAEGRAYSLNETQTPPACCEHAEGW
jgi:hypothetical protein